MGIFLNEPLPSQPFILHVAAHYIPRGLYLEALEDLGVEQREDDHLLEGPDVVAQPPHGVKGHGAVDGHGVDVGQAGTDSSAISDHTLRGKYMQINKNSNPGEVSYMYNDETPMSIMMS